MKQSLIILSCCIFFLSACTNKKTKLREEITSGEKVLFSNGNAFKMKTSDVTTLICKYELYANSFPEDTLAAEYLFKSADLYTGIKNYQSAMKAYEKVMIVYPTYSKLSYCIFLAGFTAENYLHDLVAAKKYYELFLLKYPSAAMAKDVKFSLQNLGKSPDDIVKEFEQKQAMQDSLQKK